MRRLAFAFAFVWLIAAFCVRLIDMRRPGLYISALTGGQQGEQVTIAWLQGDLHRDAQRGRGRLVVAEARVDGKLLRHSSTALPPGWQDCLLWLEEGPGVVQALASCPGHQPTRLSADGRSLPGLGPDNRPALLQALAPLDRFDPERIVNLIHRRELAPPHPTLLFLGVLAMLPLLVLAAQDLRRSRRMRGTPTLEGTIETAESGVLTLRTADRRVTVYSDAGQVLSLGLSGALANNDSMAAQGLRAAIQGPVSTQAEQGFRHAETVRLLPQSILVVGDRLQEASARLQRVAIQNGILALLGIVLSAVIAMPFG